MVNTKLFSADSLLLPENRDGWPWAVVNTLSLFQPPQRGWPRISIITPSFNQGQYLEETIRSVLMQGYPNLEYIIIDGGSTDDSVAVIQRYEQWLTSWLSEPDRGQANAINKGLQLATGEIFNWINSDDVLLPGALFNIAAAFLDVDAVVAPVIHFDKTGDKATMVPANLSPENLIAHRPGTVFQQPGFWLDREKVQECGGIDEEYHYSFDWDLAIRYLHLAPRIAYLRDPVARFRLHAQSKTISAAAKFLEDEVKVVRKLRQDEQYATLHISCSRWLKHITWWWKLDTIASMESQHKGIRAFRMAAVIVRKPHLRLRRTSLRRIRRMLYPVKR